MAKYKIKLERTQRGKKLDWSKELTIESTRVPKVGECTRTLMNPSIEECIVSVEEIAEGKELKINLVAGQKTIDLFHETIANNFKKLQRSEKERGIILVPQGKVTKATLRKAVEIEKENSQPVNIVIVDDIGAIGSKSISESAKEKYVIIGEDKYVERKKDKKQDVLKIPKSILYVYRLHLAASGYKTPVKSHTVIDLKKLVREFKLIQNKKSLLSRNEREQVIKLFNKYYKKIT